MGYHEKPAKKLGYFFDMFMFPLDICYIYYIYMDILISWKTTPSPVHNSQTPHKHLNGSWMFVLPLDMDIEQLLGISWDIMKTSEKIWIFHWYHEKPSHALILSIRQATWLPATFQRLPCCSRPHQGKAHHASPRHKASRVTRHRGSGPKMGTVQVVSPRNYVPKMMDLYDLYGIIWIFDRDFREKNPESRWFSQQNINEPWNFLMKTSTSSPGESPTLCGWIAVDCNGPMTIWMGQNDQIMLRYGSVSKPCTPGEHQNSWDLWMFIPLEMVLIGIDPYPYVTNWWYTYPSEKWWSSSVGMMTFPIYGNNIYIYVPNQQPAIILVITGYML